MSKKASSKKTKAKFDDFDVTAAIAAMAPPPPAPTEAVEFVPMPVAPEMLLPTMQVTVGLPTSSNQAEAPTHFGLVKEPGPPTNTARVTVDGGKAPPIPSELIDLL